MIDQQPERVHAQSSSPPPVNGSSRVALIRRAVAVPLMMSMSLGGLVGVPAYGQDSPPALSNAASDHDGIGQRGDGGAGRGIAVRHVAVSDSGGSVIAAIDWNKPLMMAGSGRDRFSIRLVAYPMNAAKPIVLTHKTYSHTSPTSQRLRLTLGKGKAYALRAAADVVLAVSQQHAGTADKNFTSAYVSITHLNVNPAGAGTVADRSTAMVRTGRDCSARLIRSGAHLAGCDLAGASLPDCVLNRVLLTNANLSGAVLRGCSVTAAKLAGADLVDTVTGQLIGSPKRLPSGWWIARGAFKRAKHTVIFHPNGGIGSMKPQSAKRPTVLAANQFSRDGYRFTGWNTHPQGRGTGYADRAIHQFAPENGHTGNRAYPSPATKETLYAQWAPSCANGGTCVLGDTGPGGGTVFYVNESNPAGSRYMEAAPLNWNGGLDPLLAWGLNSCASNDIAGADGTAIGTGLANSAAIIAACGPADAPAAYAAFEYVGARYTTDWFLPSREEVNAMDTSGIGNLFPPFVRQDYWSSSQQTGWAGEHPNAWMRKVGLGGGPDNHYPMQKSVLNAVRPVRAF